MTEKIGNSSSLVSLASNLEFCLVSRKTSKVQEIAHYTYGPFFRKPQMSNILTKAKPAYTFMKN